MNSLATDMQLHKNGNFTDSATRLNELGATDYTLVTISSDNSYSVEKFKDAMEEALKESVSSCKYSKRADNLMLRHTTFNDTVVEHHGFKLLAQINENDYTNSLNPDGSTALYDAALDAANATGDYAKQLLDASFNVNGVIFFITDGDNNASLANTKMVKDAIAKLHKKNKDDGQNKMESLVTILIAVNVNDPYILMRLEDFKNEVGINKFINLKDASKKSLAKLAEFVSKSISASSQALGTGGPSKQIMINNSSNITDAVDALDNDSLVI